MEYDQLKKLTLDEIKDLPEEDLASIDVEAELLRILNEEVWKELEATQGITKQSLDEQLVQEMIKIYSQIHNPEN